MNLSDAIADSLDPAAPAFVFNGRVTTYQEFHSILGSFTEIFYLQGVRPGDFVGLFMGYDPFHCIAILALARLGAISVPIDPGWSVYKRKRLVAQFGVQTLVSYNEGHEIDNVKSIRLSAFLPLKPATETVFANYVPQAATPFRMSLTSGKTGDPKGELLTQGYQLDRIKKTLHDCDSNSRVMPFSLNHPMGLTIAIGVLTVGGTLVFPTAYNSESFVAAINLHTVTHIFVSPTMATKILALVPETGMAFPTLRHLRLVGGAPSEALLGALRSRATPHVFVSYGSSEVGPIALATPEILAAQPRSCGKTLPWVKLELLDESGQVLTPPNSGEIRVKIDGAPTEYHGNDKATSEKFRDGWFYTGDFGRLDADGLLFIEGRIDDVVNLGGPKVNLDWIDQILEKHPQVAEATSFVMNDTGSPLIAAAIIPREANIDIESVFSHAKLEIGSHHPKRLFIQHEFPRTPSGKIMRAEVASSALQFFNKNPARS
ncbi:MAG: class I adenylate-forming enzyme family protein [Burkholderiaceae bacterium]|nr:class I adenylate-forming enzyme family protein [Burkholderiaceae bacterium]